MGSNIILDLFSLAFIIKFFQNNHLSWRKGDRISAQQPDVTLNIQLQAIQQELDRVIKVELSDRQLSPLASLAFNVGVDFLKNSTLINK